MPIPTRGDYVSVQLRGDHVLTGFLREPYAGNGTQNRLYIKFPHRTSLIADLEPLHNNKNKNFRHNRCFIQIRPNFFLSAFLDTNIHTNQMREFMSVVLSQYNANNNIRRITLWGILEHYDGYLPTWARNTSQ